MAERKRIGSGRISRLVGVAVLALLVTLQSAAGRLARSDAPRAHPNRLIVKYKPIVSRCARRMLASGESFAAVTGADSLDRLHARLGVASARSLVVPREHLAGAQAARAYATRIAGARVRYPERAARAPAGAAAPDLSNLYVLEYASTLDPVEAAALYNANPAVEYAEPDYELRLALVPNDPFFSSVGTWGRSYPDLWGLHVTEAASAWDVSAGSGILVAVIDTGVDGAHPDIAANMWTNVGEIADNGEDDDGNGFVDDVLGWDFRHDDPDPFDDNGHGTHVAGTVAATGNNGLGVPGMAWEARIMPVKAFSAEGRAWTSDTTAAVIYATENGADILSNSWGGIRSWSLENAIDTAVASGVVVVAATGNEGSSVISPASYPSVIAAAASTPDDEHASFSNQGPEVSVAAPGSDILSLRSSEADPVGGATVAADYLRLSGTSMAAPHVSGLAAVLLAAMPSLTINEVRWHLELNADQLGYPGFEGEPWNPALGWGRINAANVFDTPPVTTRMGDAPESLHAFVGQVRPEVGSVSFAFTTESPVPWTLATPMWLPASPDSGGGSAEVSVSLDTTALAPGVQSGSIAVDAPGAVDGGGSRDVRVTVHRDERVGPEIVIESIGDNKFRGGPVAAGDGLGTLVAYSLYDSGAHESRIHARRIDSAGNLGPSFVVTQSASTRGKSDLGIASDGRNFLIVWSQWYSIGERDIDQFFAIRVDPHGQPIDAAPILLEERREGNVSGIVSPKVASDGESYYFMWKLLNVATDRDKVFIRRLGTDTGRRGRRRTKIYPTSGTTKQIIYPHIACMTGHCMVVWSDADGETSDEGMFIKKARVIRLVNGRPITKQAQLVLTDSGYVNGITTDGIGYFVIGNRVKYCPGPVECSHDVLGARVTKDGVPLDPDGIRLQIGPDSVDLSRGPRSAAFDGTNWVTAFLGKENTSSTDLRTASAFLARVSPDGQVIDSEPEGLLVQSAETDIYDISLTATASGTLAVWTDSRADDPDRSYLTYGTAVAQPMLDRGTAADFPGANIGSIGPVQVDEGSVVRFALAAPGLNAGTTAFTATNLPPGAVLESTTGLFQWQPAPDEAGVYPDVELAASDGSSTVSEAVTFTVNEALLSLSGTVRLADGTPVPALAVALKGLKKSRPVIFTDPTGRYTFERLPAGRYRLRIGKPSKKEYFTEPKTLRVDLGVADIADADFVATPR